VGPLISLLILITAIVAIVLVSFSRPLTEEQIPKLAQKRRKRRILLYFSPNSFSYFSLTMEFKSGLKPDGKLYQFDLEMPHVPSFVAELLKYKKHEWPVMVLLRDRKSECLWANKGPDRTRVHLVSINSILKNSQRKRMRCHNGLPQSSRSRPPALFLSRT